MKTRIWSRYGNSEDPPNAVLFVEGSPQEQQRDAICGKLEDEGEQPDGHHYKVIATGYIWVYTTDCNGTMQSGYQYPCVPGNTLIVVGCHAFGCIRD